MATKIAIRNNGDFWPTRERKFKMVNRKVRRQNGIRVVSLNKRTYQVFGIKRPFVREDCPLEQQECT